MWDAVEGNPVFAGGNVGVPVEVWSLPADFNLAVDEGIGRKLWPGVGLAASSGGARRLFFGTEMTGCERSISLYQAVSDATHIK